MTETYLQKLQREHRERRTRLNPPKKIDANPEEAETEAVVTRALADFKEIFKEVCRLYNVSMLDVISERRTIKIVTARHVTAYIASQHTTLSLGAIASRLARDKSTIAHALQRMEALAKTEKMSADLIKLKERLGLV